ncbi:MAG: hypothetical protein LKM35_00670 [Lachnospiraceae bacterium]|jgi:hypothetical protein|nr:hypothetical protein [Lachnospiraceae bacterium]
MRDETAFKDRKTVLARFALFFLLALLVAAFAWSLYISYCRIDSSNYYLSAGMMILFVIVLTGIFYLLKPNPVLMCICYGALGLLFIFLYNQFSPIDEASHFSYIEFILDNRRLPSFSDTIPAAPLNAVFPGNTDFKGFYEAIQPPLYYLVSAALAGITADIKTRFYICRIFDLCLSIGAIFTLYKTMLYLAAKNAFKDLQYLAYVFLFLVFCPLFLTSGIVVTNDAMMYLLVDLFIFFLCRIIFENKGYLPAAVLLILLAWTKFSAVYFVAVLAAVLLMKRQVKKMFLSVGAVLLGISPWLIYNKAVNGDFTGAAGHVAIVSSMLNPSGEKIKWTRYMIEIPNSIRGMFNSAAFSNAGGSITYIASFLTVIILLSIAGSVIYLIRYAIQEKSIFKFQEKDILLTASVLSVLLAYLSQVYASASTNLFVITPRAMFSCAFLFLFCIDYWAEKIDIRKHPAFLKGTLAFLAAFMIVSDVYYFAGENVRMNHPTEYKSMSTMTYDNISADTMSMNYAEPLDCRSLTGTYLIVTSENKADALMEVDLSGLKRSGPRKYMNIELKAGENKKIICISEDIEDLTGVTIYSKDYKNINKLTYEIVNQSKQ